MEILDTPLLLKQMKILLVEDDPSAVIFIKGLLKDNVESIESVTDGQSALSKVEEQLPDIILSDISLPKVDGITFIKSIRQKHPDVQIIVMTGYSNEEKIYEAINAGANHYIIKPLEPQKLFIALEKSAEIIQTEQLRSENEQLMLEKTIFDTKTEIMQDIAHHWNNPLNAIAMCIDNTLEVIESKKSDPEKLNEAQYELQRIRPYILSMANKINDFRILFKNSNKTQSFDLKKKLEETVQMATESVECNDLELKVQCPENTEFHSHVENIKMVIYHLVKNAIEAGMGNKSHATEVSVTAHKIGHTLHLSVEDNGGGIDDEAASRMFEPYYSTKGVQSGTGVGLFLVKNIIQNKLDGQILWENIPRGTRFSVTITEHH